MGGYLEWGWSSCDPRWCGGTSSLPGTKETPLQLPRRPHGSSSLGSRCLLVSIFVIDSRWTVKVCLV
jgi:hypothetical protein